eukprot:913972_1
MDVYDDKKHNDAMPPGFNANTNDQSYPPNRYRPNDTNNSELNRNWRNRFNPDLNATASDMSPSFRARTMNSHWQHSQHSHSRSPPHNINQNVMNDIKNVSPLIGSAQADDAAAINANKPQQLQHQKHTPHHGGNSLNPQPLQQPLDGEEDSPQEAEAEEDEPIQSNPIQCVVDIDAPRRKRNVF